MKNTTIHLTTADTEIGTLLDIIQKRSNAQTLVIVPESMTLAYEQVICGEKNGIMDVSVTSMKNLQKHILDTYGYGPASRGKKPVIITKGGTIARIYTLCEKHADELIRFKTPRIQTAEKIYDTITELRDAGLDTPEAVEKAAAPGSVPVTLKELLHDVAFLWSKLTELDSTVTERTVMEMDLFDEAISQAGAAAEMAGKNVIICGFDYPYRRIITMINTVCDSYVDWIFKSAPEGSMIGGTPLGQLKHLTDGYKLEIASDDISRHKYNEQILALANRSAGCKVAYNGPYDRISVYRASSQYIECLHAAQQAIEWHNSGYQWNEIGIVIDGNETLNEMIPQVLSAAGVPCFNSTRQSALLCSSAYYVSKVIASCNGYQVKDMIDIVKSEFSPLTRDERQKLENYVVTNGIRGSKWLQPFVARNPADKAEEMNALREKLMEPIIDLHKAFRNRKLSATGQVKELFDFLERTGFYDRIREREKEYQRLGLYEESEMSRQSWHSICTFINTMATELFTGEHLTLKSLTEISAALLYMASMKSIPQTANAVLLDKSRMFVAESKKACIIVSEQESDSVSITTLLSDTDRSVLEMANPDRMLFFRRQQDKLKDAISMEQYLMATSATERLCISCSTVSHSGKVMNSGHLYNLASELLEEHNPENIRGGLMNNGIRPFAHDATIEMLADKMRTLRNYGDGALSASDDSREAQEWKSAYLYIERNEPETIALFKKALGARVIAEDIDPKTAVELYNTEITSVSELEAFAACPFSHFVKYGLKAQEIRDYAFEADHKGIFYHAAMKAYIEKAQKDPSFPKLDNKTIIRYFNDAVAPLVEEMRNGPLMEDVLSRMELTEYVTTARASALYCTKWLEATGYLPKGCEVTFGKSDSSFPALEFKLTSGNMVKLKGVIDRYDTHTDETGNTYVRIVDYKTSEKVLDREAVEKGGQLQLPIYLAAVLQANPGMKPSGALYQTIANSPVNNDTDNEDEIWEKVMASTKLTGMYLVDKDGKMEKGHGDSVKASTRATKNIMACTGEELAEVVETSKKRVVEHANAIENGKISINPVTYSRRDPCEYCKSSAICGYRKQYGGTDDE